MMIAEFPLLVQVNHQHRAFATIRAVTDFAGLELSLTVSGASMPLSRHPQDRVRTARLSGYV